MDADDIALPKRLATQVQFMDSHPEVGICGTWQHHYGPDRDWVHKAPSDSNMCKARLLFWCDMCHSTLMLRKNVFIENNLFYDPDRKAEDFELWTRAIQFTEVANIPQVLGEYKEDGTSITAAKFDSLHQESGYIIASTLNRLWGMELSDDEAALFNNWQNDYSTSPYKKEMLDQLEVILRTIWEKNQEQPVFEDAALLQVLAGKWHWAKNNASWEGLTYRVNSIDDIFDDQISKPSLMERNRVFLENNPSWKVRIKKILKKILQKAKKAVKICLGIILFPILWPLRKLIKILFKDVIRELEAKIENWTWDRYQRTNKDIEHWTWERYLRTNKNIERWTWDRYKRTNKDIEHWTWDRYKRTNKDTEHWTWERYKRTEKLITEQNRTIENIYQNVAKYTPYKSGEKIRLCYLFQLPSCWPSFESVWEVLKDDSRFDVKFLLFDREQREKAQMAGARQFLEDLGVEYEEAEKFDLLAYRPHVYIFQTPWDEAHRPAYLQSNRIREANTRIAYIPYGIEYSNSVWPEHRFSNNKFKTKPWKMFTLSPQMRFEHHLQSPQGSDHIVPTGLPKFDLIYNRDRFPLEEEVRELIGGRKVVFWQMHFPALDGTPDIPEANVAEYTAFAKDIERYKDDYFFLVRLHPKFFEQYTKLGYEVEVEQFRQYLEAAENVYMYNQGDYMPALLAADAVIGDRSALMVESSALHVPVLYMTNFWYHEQMLNAVAPLFNSYYQGSQVYDMHRFMTMVLTEGFDYKKQEREEAFAECIPFFDGNCGRRIVEHIVDALNAEVEE